MSLKGAVLIVLVGLRISGSHLAEIACEIAGNPLLLFSDVSGLLFAVYAICVLGK